MLNVITDLFQRESTKTKQGWIKQGALVAPTLRVPQQNRLCFENDESKSAPITTSIIASESKFLFERQPCAGEPE